MYRKLSPMELDANVCQVLLEMAPQGMPCLVKVRLWHELADCINTDGGYECVCKDGAIWDGLSCVGKVMA